MRPKKPVNIGGKYGRLTILSEESPHKYPSGKIQRIVKCKCDCGNIIEITLLRILSGNTKSCGCFRREYSKEKNKTHGKTHTRLYNIWCTMRARCNNPNRQKYQYYGGRGIQVCQEWNVSFEAFYQWSIKNGYRDNLTIDRIDSNGNYTPENCRWVTWKEQQNNRRSNKIVTINGVSKTLSEWSDYSGVKSGTILNRIELGWSGLKLIQTPKTRQQLPT